MIPRVVSHEAPARKPTISDPTAKRGCHFACCQGATLTTSPCVVSPPWLGTRLTRCFVAEGVRLYTLGIFGIVGAVPMGAIPSILRVHFAPLRRFLAFMQIAADSQQTFRFRAGYRVSGGRTGISPCLTSKSEGSSVASIVFQALRALNSTCTFQIAPQRAHLQV